MRIITRSPISIMKKRHPMTFIVLTFSSFVFPQ